MSGCGARTAAGSLEAVFESSDVERFFTMPAAAGIDEEWEAAMTTLRDLQATASRLYGEAAQDKARAETNYENAIARADGLRAAIEALNETKPVGQHDDKP